METVVAGVFTDQREDELNAVVCGRWVKHQLRPSAGLLAGVVCRRDWSDLDVALLVATAGVLNLLYGYVLHQVLLRDICPHSVNRRAIAAPPVVPHALVDGELVDTDVKALTVERSLQGEEAVRDLSHLVAEGRHWTYLVGGSCVTCALEPHMWQYLSPMAIDS